MADNILPFPKSGQNTDNPGATDSLLEQWAAVLKSLTAWLKVNHPAALSRIRPPAPPADIEALQQTCPEVPEALIALLKHQDGEWDASLKGMMFDHYRLLTAAEIRSFRETLSFQDTSIDTETATLSQDSSGLSSDKLIPFAARQGQPSGLLCITPKNHIEAVIEITHAEVIEFEADLVTFFQQYSTGLREGAFEIVKTAQGRLIKRKIDDKPDLQTKQDFDASQAYQGQGHQEQSTQQSPPTNPQQGHCAQPNEEATGLHDSAEKQAKAIETAAKAVLPELLMIKAPDSDDFDMQQWGDPSLIKELHQRLVKADFHCYGFTLLEGQIHGTLIKHLSYWHDKDRIFATIIDLASSKTHQSVGVAVELNHVFSNNSKHLITWNSTGRYANLSPPGVLVQVAQAPIIMDMRQQLSNMRGDLLPLRVAENQCIATLQQGISYSFNWLLEQPLDLEQLAKQTDLFQQVGLERSEPNIEAFKLSYQQWKDCIQSLQKGADQSQLPKLVKLQHL
jgi:hypothetical protein